MDKYFLNQVIFAIHLIFDLFEDLFSIPRIIIKLFNKKIEI